MLFRSTQGLVACEVEGDRRARLFYRRNGAVESESAPLRLFLLLEGEDWLKGWKGETEIVPLDGNASFNRLARFADLKQLEDAKAFLQKQSGKTPSASDAPYLYINDPVHQHLLLSGQTHFLGLTFSDLRRMQLDIETYCQSGFEFPNPARESDRITAIAMSDSTGWERLISGKEFDEAEMLRELDRKSVV